MINIIIYVLFNALNIRAKSSSHLVTDKGPRRKRLAWRAAKYPTNNDATCPMTLGFKCYFVIYVQ